MSLKKTAMLVFAVVMAAGFFGAVKLSSSLIRDVPLLADYFSGDELVIARSVTRAFVGMAIFLAITIAAGAAGVRIFRVKLGLWRAPLRGWIPAAITAGIHIGVNVAFFLEEPERITEPSAFNLYVSGVTALGGGVFEEIIFRGVILGGLALAGFSKIMSIVISAALFAGSHAGWLAAAPASAPEFFLATSPIWGTFILGLALGFAYTESRGYLAPVIAAHGAINLALEPWLLLSFVR